MNEQNLAFLVFRDCCSVVTMAGDTTRSSLPLAVILFFTGKFSYIYFLIEFVLFIYKGLKYNYPEQVCLFLIGDFAKKFCCERLTDLIL